MTNVTLDHLPTLVLHRICNILWNDSFKDLVTFSAANEACREAAAPFVFKRRIIKVASRKQLSDDVQTLIEACSGNRCHKFLRQLTVEGTMPLLEKDIGQAFEEDHWRRLEKAHREDSDKSPFKTFFAYLQGSVEHPEDDREEMIRAWSPLAHLITRLRCLTDLTFACTNQFPPNLLENLHQHHPFARLHLPSFHFRGLEETSIDPHELAIMTSPCLHSMGVSFVGIDSNEGDGPNEEAIRHAVAMAPNLQHLTTVERFTRGSLATSRHTRDRQPLQRFFPPADGSRKASLRSLSLCNNRFSADQSLWEWKNHTDFSKLVTLYLINVVQIEPLANAAVNNTFMSLRELSIGLVKMSNDPSESQAEVFFDNLQPLTVLSLQGYITKSMVTVIAARHGGTLRDLRIRPQGSYYASNPDTKILKSADISDLAAKCPLLERLHLPIKRYKSDPHETECYEALGNFPSLASISLTLECAKPLDSEIVNADAITSGQHATDTDEGEVHKNALMQYALIDCAVDGKLARSIWDIISTNRIRGCRLMDLSINTSVRLDTYAGSTSRDFRFRLGQIAGSYLLKRRSDSSDSEDIEIIDRAKTCREQRFEKNQGRRMGRVLTPQETLHLNQTQAAFERVWPRRKGTADWREDWSSRPLQRTI